MLYSWIALSLMVLGWIISGAAGVGIGCGDKSQVVNKCMAVSFLILLLALVIARYSGVQI